MPVLDQSDVIYERTHAGQIEVLRMRLPLGSDARRILAMFTGYTPLSELQPLAGCPTESVDNLLAHQLIRPAGNKHQERPVPHWVDTRRRTGVHAMS